MNDREGTWLPGIVCPKCGKVECEYEGNYYCASCDWVLPDHHGDNRRLIKSMRNWFALAYTTVMNVRGEKADPEVVERIMREGY